MCEIHWPNRVVKERSSFDSKPTPDSLAAEGPLTEATFEELWAEINKRNECGVIAVWQDVAKQTCVDRFRYFGPTAMALGLANTLHRKLARLNLSLANKMPGE